MLSKSIRLYVKLKVRGMEFAARQKLQEIECQIVQRYDRSLSATSPASRPTIAIPPAS